MSAGVARADGTHEVATHGERLIVVGHWSGLPQRVIPLMSNAGLTLKFFDTMNPDDAAELYLDEHPSFVEHAAVAVEPIFGVWSITAALTMCTSMRASRSLRFPTDGCGSGISGVKR